MGIQEVLWDVGDDMRLFGKNYIDAGFNLL